MRIRQIAKVTARLSATVSTARCAAKLHIPTTTVIHHLLFAPYKVDPEELHETSKNEVDLTAYLRLRTLAPPRLADAVYSSMNFHLRSTDNRLSSPAIIDITVRLVKRYGAEDVARSLRNIADDIFDALLCELDTIEDRDKPERLWDIVGGNEDAPRTWLNRRRQLRQQKAA